MEKYLETHKTAIVTFLDQLNTGLIDVPDIELRLPRSFLQLHEVITNILKENDLIPKKEE
jgi:hypothetical protein